MAEFIEIEFPFHASQRERFQTGALVAEWAERYQSLFDFEDVQLARQQPNRHFFEWLAAVLLFESI